MVLRHALERDLKDKAIPHVQKFVVKPAKEALEQITNKTQAAELAIKTQSMDSIDWSLADVADLYKHGIEADALLSKMLATANQHVNCARVRRSSERARDGWSVFGERSDRMKEVERERERRCRTSVSGLPAEM